MLFNSYSYEILYEQFHWTYLPGEIKLLLVTVNNRLKFEIEIVHDLSCHLIVVYFCLREDEVIQRSIKSKSLLRTLSVTVTIRMLATRKANDVRLLMSSPLALTVSESAPYGTKNSNNEVTIASPVLCANTRLLKNRSRCPGAYSFG